MALPGNYDTEVVTGQYLNLDGSPAQGTVTFTPQLASGTFLTDASVPVAVLPTNFVCPLDGTGSFTTHIPATNDTDISPTGWTYKVTEQFGINTRTYAIVVGVGTGPIDLVTVAPSVSVTGSVTMVKTVNGLSPDVNGNINVTAVATGAYGQQSFGVGPTSYTFTPVGSGSAYFLVDKTGSGNDGSIVFRDTGTAIAEIGNAADDDLHFKSVLSGTFTDAIIVKNASPNTGKVYIPVGLGVGTVPVEVMHVAGNIPAGRTTSKIENTNVSTGSVGSQIELAGNGSAWAFGTDVGLNGGNNAFLVNANGAYMTGFLVNSSGQVGILTDSPGSALDVNGALTVRGDNGLTTIRRRGIKSTAGAPTSSTWAVGDEVIDSTGVSYICSAAGTPGTWVTPYRKSAQNAATLQWAAWTGDVALMNSNVTPVAQTVYFVRSYVDQAVTCNHAYCSVVVAGVTVSGAYIGVYDVASGNLLKQTADISSSLTSIQGVQASLATALTGLALNQEIYLALLIASAGTMPQFAGVRANGGNLGMTSDYRIQVQNTGTFTTLPSTVPALKTPSSGTFPGLGIGA